MYANVKNTKMKHSILTFLFFLSNSIYGQFTDIEILEKHLRENAKNDYYSINKTKDSVKSIIYEGDYFNVKISDTLISFDKNEIVLNSPNNTYPLSFSVIYRDHIVSLFEHFGFICYRLTDFTRNYEFEEVLNTKQFQYDWVIDNDLYGLSNGSYWVLDKTDNWIKAKIKLPFNNKPTLYNDNDYISFCDCQGEWGGTVYFYNRKNQNTYFTEATCAKSIIKTNDGYDVLSSLGHMMGITDVIFISDPTKLSNLKDFNSNIDSEKALGYSDKSNHANKIFEFRGIRTFQPLERIINCFILSTGDKKLS